MGSDFRIASIVSNIRKVHLVTSPHPVARFETRRRNEISFVRNPRQTRTWQTIFQKREIYRLVFAVLRSREREQQLR